jgi:hypothetical protein
VIAGTDFLSPTRYAWKVAYKTIMRGIEQWVVRRAVRLATYFLLVAMENHNSWTLPYVILFGVSNNTCSPGFSCYGVCVRAAGPVDLH